MENEVIIVALLKVGIIFLDWLVWATLEVAQVISLYWAGVNPALTIFVSTLTTVLENS